MTELRAEIATLADPSREHDVREAVRSLADRIDELAVPPDDGVVTNRLDTIERQRATDAETIDVLLLALDRIREDLSERQPARAEHSREHDGRLDELDRSLAEVQAQLASLDERPSDPGFEERLAGLAARVEAIDTATPQTLEADPRIDVLVQSLAELRDELSSVAARPREQGADEALAMLAARVDEIASSPPPAPEADPRIDVLARSVSELRDELASLAVQPHDHTADDALALLTARVEEIAATPAPSYEPDPRVDELGDALAELRIRIESLASPPREQADDGILAALTSRVDALTSAPPAVDEERLRGSRALPSASRHSRATSRLGSPSPTRSGARASTRPYPISSNGSGSRSSASAFTWESTIGHSRTSCAVVASSAASKSLPSAWISSLRPARSTLPWLPVPRPPASRPTCSRWRGGWRRQKQPRRQIARSSCRDSRSSARRSIGACSDSRPTTRRSTARAAPRNVRPGTVRFRTRH